MSINATIDSNKYEGIETIEVGGKTIALEQTYNGSQSIVENGTYDVGGKAEVVVNVPTETTGGTEPTGSVNITTNGTHDVKAYASAVVNVPQTGYSINDFVESEGGTAILHKVSNVEVETTIIRNYAFAQLGMYKVTAPNALTFGEFAFTRCPNLTEVDAPLVTSIGKETFNMCTALTKANFPLITDLGSSINGSHFYGCKSLTEVNLPEVTKIGGNVFNGCSALQSISLPKLTTGASNSQFMGCTSLKNVDLPLYQTDVMQNMFKNCTSLEEISFPSVLKMNGATAFEGCTSLKKVDFGANCTTLKSTTPFKNCTALEKVILRYNGVVGINNGVFNSSTNGVTVYVPSAQISAYQADGVWSTQTKVITFVAIEGSEFE